MPDRKIALVLGGGGLVGKSIVQRLKSRGFWVAVASRGENFEADENLKGDIFQDQRLTQVIHHVQPRLIVNAINTATIFSKQPKQGYDLIIKFYLELNLALKSLQSPVHYVHIGTTGTGGLGFDIPFTHGQKPEEMPILNKVAFAGISSAMLLILSRSFSEDRVRVSEIKPGLAIFEDVIQEEEENGARLITLNGGESGNCTYEEFMVLTNFMGFSPATRIAELAMNVVDLKREMAEITRHDLIWNTNYALMRPQKEDLQIKQECTARMKELRGKKYIVTTGRLKPYAITRDLLLGEMICSGCQCSSEETFSECLNSHTCIQATLQYIKEKDSDLFAYLVSELSFENYKGLLPYRKQSDESWQVVCAKLAQ